MVDTSLPSIDASMTMSRNPSCSRNHGRISPSIRVTNLSTDFSFKRTATLRASISTPLECRREASLLRHHMFSSEFHMRSVTPVGDARDGFCKAVPQGLQENDLTGKEQWSFQEQTGYFPKSPAAQASIAIPTTM